MPGLEAFQSQSLSVFIQFSFNPISVPFQFIFMLFEIPSSQLSAQFRLCFSHRLSPVSNPISVPLQPCLSPFYPPVSTPVSAPHRPPFQSAPVPSLRRVFLCGLRTRLPLRRALTPALSVSVCVYACVCGRQTHAGNAAGVPMCGATARLQMFDT